MLELPIWAASTTNAPDGRYSHTAAWSSAWFRSV